MTDNPKLIIALPKGRILAEIMPILGAVNIVPEPEFNHDESRKLSFSTNHPTIDLIRVRSFDVATFVAFGAAHIGVAGADVLEEFRYSEIFAPLDLGIGRCRLSLAEPADLPAGRAATAETLERLSHLRIASKYPNTTHRFFARRGIQIEPIKLNGAMELAPKLGLCDQIVDLVSSGATLKANGLVEVMELMAITSRLIVNRTAMKTRPLEMGGWIDSFAAAIAQKSSAA
ncbi:MAG: ATP phosphoribosyltransferase [Candidatus Pacebacteria bacterium]|nr:ATP phosphoribosyltransferase [Candidatus Paceibacterota bacterium]